MSLTINPPALTKVTTYEKFRQVTLAWTEIIDSDKEKQSIEIVLSRPEEYETNIREKDFLSNANGKSQEGKWN